MGAYLSGREAMVRYSGTIWRRSDLLSPDDQRCVLLYLVSTMMTCDANGKAGEVEE
jgi:hypothetical protein